MKRTIAVTLAALSLSSLAACGNSTSEGLGGMGGSGMVGTGGRKGSGGTMGTGGGMGTGGKVGTGGEAGTGGRSEAGTTGTTDVCPYTVASFSCDAACKKLHDFSQRCQDDPTVPEEIQALLGIYGGMEVICTNSCAVIAPSSQAQWACFQGMPDDAPCSAIAGCNATNCP